MREHVALSVSMAHVMDTESVTRRSRRPEEVSTMNEYSEYTDEQICEYCETVTSDWWLAPIGVKDDGSDYVFADYVVCVDCYDGHCTKYNIQPLK